MEPLDAPKIVFDSLLDLYQLLLQLGIIVHPLRLDTISVTRDTSRVTLPTDGTNLITLPMPDAASPASTRCGAHESGQAQSEIA
jgi:hypothetical protein